jgi:biopolymer transport protein ExbD
MKTVLLAILFGLTFASSVRANSEQLIVEIKTTDSGTSYALDKTMFNLDGDPKTPDEIEGWLREAIKKIGDREAIWIHSDDRTSFKTVLEMLHRFKAAGVKRFVVVTGSGADSQSFLLGSCDEIRLLKTSPAPPRK